MITDLQKDLIINYIKLGMDEYRACICAEVPLDEIEIVEKDEEIQARIRFEKAQREARLLEALDKAAIKAAELRGDIKGVQKCLSLLEPETYNERRQVSVKFGKEIPSHAIAFNFVDSDDNEED